MTAIATPPVTTPMNTQEPVETRIGPQDANLLWKVGKLICRFAMASFFKLKVYNRELIPDKGGVLIVSNHQSYLDPVLLAVYLRRPLSYFAKSELFKKPFFAKLIRGLHAFPVRQGAGDIGAVREAITRLKEGYALLLFPEGARTFTGEMIPLEAGVGLIARKAGVPVVPAVIHGSYDAYPRTTKYPKAHPISVQFGPPMDFTGMKASEIVAALDKTMRAMHEELRTREDSRHSPF